MASDRASHCKKYTYEALRDIGIRSGSLQTRNIFPTDLKNRTNTVIHAAAKPADFYDREWSDRWHDMKVYSPVARHTRRLIRAYLDRIEYRSILDIGCGSGELLKELSLSPSVALAGVDFSATAVRQASETVPGDFGVVDIEKDVPDLTADAGVCSEVLEHLVDDEAAIRNMSRCVDHLVVTVPSGPLTQASLDIGHVRHYTKALLAQKLEENGFEVVTIRAWGTPFHDPLYAWIRSRSPEGATTGSYGLGKRLVSSLLYGLFHLNILDRGHKLVALARSTQERSNT